MTARPQSVRGLTEGAILATLVALFALATRYLPVIGIAAALVCPLPLAVLVIRQGVRIAVLAAVVAGTVGAIIGGPMTGLSIVITFAPLGIVLGLGVRRRHRAGTILVASVAVVTVSLLINLGLTLVIAGVNPYTTLIEGMQQGQERAVQLYERLGISREQIHQATGPMRQMLDLLPRLIPLLVVVGGATTAYLNYQVGRAVLRKLGETLPALPPMSTWRVPPLFLWALPVSFFLTEWGRRRYPAMETAGLNIFVLAQMVFSVQGLAVGWALFDRYTTPRWLRWVIIAFAVTNPLLGVVAFALGLADAAFDLRRRLKPAEAPQRG